MQNRESLMVLNLVDLWYYWTIVTGEVLSMEGCPTAVKSKLGWLLSDPTQATNSMMMVANPSISECVPLTLSSSEEVELTQLLKNFWQLDSLVHQREVMRKNNLKGSFWKGYILLTLGTRLDYLGYLQDVPCHFHMCLNRLRALQHWLLKDVDVLKEYNKIMEDQPERGIVERVDTGLNNGNQVHYLPYLSVIRSRRSTTKV